MKQGGLPPSSPYAAERRERLRLQTGEAALRLSRPAQRHGATLQPGDLLVLPTCEAALWWLVLKTQDQALTLIPADDREWTGISDLRVPADFFPGPLTLRCAFLAETEARTPALADAHCVGQLPAALLRRAVEVHEAFESGTLDPSARQEDDDFDPLYQDWIQEAIRPALTALAAHTAGGGGAGRVDNVVNLAARRTPTSPVWLRALAAVLAVALVGVGWGWWGAQRELGEYQAVSIQPETIARFAGQRAEIGEVQVPHSSRPVASVNIELPILPTVAPTLELQLLAADGTVLLSLAEHWPKNDQLNVNLPRSLLQDDGLLRLRLSGEPEPLDLRIRLLPPGVEPTPPRS